MVLDSRGLSFSRPSNPSEVLRAVTALSKMTEHRAITLEEFVDVVTLIAGTRTNPEIRRFPHVVLVDFGAPVGPVAISI